jgi:Tfp pilus assembly protein PilF
MSEDLRQKRITTLQTFLEKDPNDSFTRYALALEFLNGNELREAIRELESILNNDEEYIATYYQLAKAYVSIGEKEKAKSIYEKGITLTESKGDSHTNQELREALALLT